MTLNAAIVLDGIEVLISDILVTGKNSRHQLDILPTIENLRSALPEEWMNTVTGMVRKTDIIGQSLAVSFSGNGFAAKHVLDELWRQRPHSDYTKDKLNKVLAECSNLGQAMHCDVTGLISIDGIVETVHWSTKAPETISYNNNCLRLAGSGWPAFEEMMKTAGRSVPKDADRYASNKIQSASLCSSLFARQMIEPATIWDLSGGAYEAITFNGKGFELVDDYACFVWEAFKDNGGIGLRMARMPMRFSYWHDCLHIKQYQYPDKQSISDMKIGLPQHYIVTPLRNILEPKMLRDSVNELHTRHFGVRPFAIIHVVAFPGSMIMPVLTDQHIAITTTVDTEMNPISYFMEEKDGLHIGFSKDFPEKLRSSRESIRNPARANSGTQY